jgi:hypothetical protein
MQWKEALGLWDVEMRWVGNRDGEKMLHQWEQNNDKARHIKGEVGIGMRDGKEK